MPKAFCRKKGTIETSDWMMGCYAACERKAFLGSVLGIEPVHMPFDSPLEFGKKFHLCIEEHHNKGDWKAIITSSYGSELNSFEEGSRRPQDQWGATFYYWLWEMMKGYEAHWSDEWGEVRSELSFRQPIQNPETLVQIGSMRHKGRADAVLRADAEFVWGDDNGLRPGVTCVPGWYLKECKTASQVDNAYAGRLDADDQILLYAYNLERELGIKFEGILYDVMVKPPKKANTMQPGEDADAFKARKAAMLKRAMKGELGSRLKQLSGQSEDTYRAKQAKLKKRRKETDEEFAARQGELEWKKAETDEEFLYRRILKGQEEVEALQLIERTPAVEIKSRLAAHFAKPTSFQRLFIPINDDMVRMKLTDQFARAQRIKFSVERYEETGESTQFLRNWKSCWPVFGRCEFWELCKSGERHAVMDESYKRRRPDEKADEEESTKPRERLPATMADVYKRSLLAPRDNDDDIF